MSTAASSEPTALVTGATRGIGNACALLLADSGWNVVGVGRDPAALSQLGIALGARGLAFECDVTVPTANHDAVAACLDTFGGLDAAVASAGVTLAKTIDDTSDDDFDHVINANLRALVYLAQAVHRPLAQRRGSFTLVASNKGLVAQRGSPMYVASKGAVVQLARALALDWADEGVRVNALCPGVVDTSMLRGFIAASPRPDQELRAVIDAQPVGRLATPAECAGVVAFLVSSAASYLTGVALPVDGGFTAQ
jgi:NAD(P)-dependent dehydrogenase (short-subunit alcohol dehydrogenase family)